MRIVDAITKTSYDVADWICEKNNINQKEMYVKKETEKAFLMCFDEGIEYWVPKSQCRVIEHSEDIGGFA